MVHLVTEVVFSNPLVLFDQKATRTRRTPASAPKLAPAAEIWMTWDHRRRCPPAVGQMSRTMGSQWVNNGEEWDDHGMIMG